MPQTHGLLWERALFVILLVHVEPVARVADGAAAGVDADDGSEAVADAECVHWCWR